ncbi:MAG TPA: aminotransferase class V-fold PLP-dependent enzyme [Candidatus Competibacteraceae bacterium]|nr:aminotransferase class V-fold PLP-dependent enzyme [Candidatus Competibacteraceae bacterium]
MYGEYGEALHKRLQHDFLGLDVRYPLADGRVRRRHYLDSAASTLRLGAAHRLAEAFLGHYGSTHSELHYGARIASAAYRWAHDQVLRFVGADPEHYTCFFAGSGATAGVNRMARTLAALRPERDTVLVSEMEHHSNDLPHRRHSTRVLHIPLSGTAPALGAIDLKALARLLEANRGRVNYLAITGASNVTGILNPLADIAELAHAHGAWLLVDGAQWVAHAPVRMSAPEHPARALDVLVFSGHKIYAPGAPGVVVARRELLAGGLPDELGGGMVEDVFLSDYMVSPHFPEREEAGTPNIVGAVMLGAVLELLMRVGMDSVHAAEARLLARALPALAALPGVRVYGITDPACAPRTGIISFNLEGLDHGLVAAILNDYYNIAVRNACFCAHPYVREMLKPELWALDIDPDTPRGLEAVELKRGMVRASFGLYTTEDDVEALIAALADILERREHYAAQYAVDADGVYRHRRFRLEATALFDPARVLDSLLPPT